MKSRSIRMARRTAGGCLYAGRRGPGGRIIGEVAPAVRRSPSPKLRPVWRVIPGLSCGFSGLAGWLWWLLQAEGDRGADQVEGLALGAGGLGEHRDLRGGAGEADLVAGQGGQVLDQAAEAVVGLPGRVVLAGGLGLGS